MDPFVNPNKIISNSFGGGNNNGNVSQNTDIFGAIGTLISSSNMNSFGSNLSPSTSPHTSSSTSSSHSIVCGRCDVSALSRCLDCNDALCDDCVNIHQKNSFTKDHYVIGMGKVTPVGGISLNSGPNEFNSLTDPQCDVHGEILRYLCETCKLIVCQECTLVSSCQLHE